jgi:hypothetical protein
MTRAARDFGKGSVTFFWVWLTPFDSKEGAEKDRDVVPARGSTMTENLDASLRSRTSPLCMRFLLNNKTEESGTGLVCLYELCNYKELSFTLSSFTSLIRDGRGAP